MQSSTGKDFVKNLNTSFREEKRSLRESFSTFQGHASRNQSILSQQSQHELLSIVNNDEFLSIKNVMNSNIDWMKIETVHDPICIITSTFPFLILKSSNSFSNMLNLPNSDLFGQTLRSLACPPHTPIDQLEEIQKNRATIDEFYSKLESKQSDYHCVLNILPHGTESLVPYVVYAFPITYRELVYQEYYPGLVSILPESIGTTFSSEYFEYPHHPKPNSSPLNATTKPNKFQRSETQQSTPSSFQPVHGILYYQLHFSKIEYLSSEYSGSSKNQNSTIIENFTRLFSTSSVKSSSIFNRTDTTNTSNTIPSQRLLSTSSGISEKWKNRDSGIADSSRSSKMRRSNNSQSTISISSRIDPLERNALEEQEQSAVNHEEIKSEKSLEFDSLEGGLMLERTNTNNSLKSLNSDGGWVNKY